MNSITDLLDLEDSDINISDIIVEGRTKTLIIETPPVAHYCPTCGYRMHSRGVKKRTINHPILQDGYSLILSLKQRRWRCSNPDCLYEVNMIYYEKDYYAIPETGAEKAYELLRQALLAEKKMAKLISWGRKTIAGTITCYPF